MSFRSLSIFFSTTFSLHFIPFLFVGNFIDSGRTGISMAFLSIYILSSALAFIFHSSYVHPLFSIPEYTSFIFHPRVYILYFPPQNIHPLFSTPIYTSFIFHPKIYILYFPPQNIHPLFSTPIYTSFIFHPKIYILYFPPQNIHPLFSTPIYTSFIFHPKIYILFLSAPKYTSFIFHPDIYILHFLPQNKDRLFCTPIYTSFSFHPKICILYSLPQYKHPIFSTPIYTPVIFHPNIYTIYFPPHLYLSKGSHPIFSRIITFLKNGNEYVSPFYIQIFWQSIISSHGFAPFFCPILYMFMRIRLSMSFSVVENTPPPFQKLHSPWAAHGEGGGVYRAMVGAGRPGLAPKSWGKEHEGRPVCERGEARPPRQESVHVPEGRGGIKPVSMSSQMVHAVGPCPPPPPVAWKGVPSVAH
jgi:hypothetical protein